MALVAVLAVGFSVRGFFVQDCDFDRSAWADAMKLDEQSYPRYDKAHEMAENLVECDDLLGGRTKPEVREMLGRPGERYKRGRIWAYDIGVHEDLSDYPPLEVEFGRDGRVRQARIAGYVEPWD